MKDYETQENAAPGGTCAADGSVPGTPAYLGDQLRDSVHALLREAELNGFRIRVEPFAGGHTYGVGRAGEMLGKDAPNEELTLRNGAKRNGGSVQ